MACGSSRKRSALVQHRRRQEGQHQGVEKTLRPGFCRSYLLLRRTRPPVGLRIASAQDRRGLSLRPAGIDGATGRLPALDGRTTPFSPSMTRSRRFHAGCGRLRSLTAALRRGGRKAQARSPVPPNKGANYEKRSRTPAETVRPTGQSDSCRAHPVAHLASLEDAARARAHIQCHSGNDCPGCPSSGAIQAAAMHAIKYEVLKEFLLQGCSEGVRASP